MKKIILFFLLVSTNWIFSQSWNNINFVNSAPGSTSSYVEHSIKDNSNNIFVKAFHNYINSNANMNAIEKYDNNNNLLWSKLVSVSNIQNIGNTDRKLQLSGSDIYMNDYTNTNKGIIIKTPNSNVASYTAWETLGGTSFSRINDIKIVGNYLYTVGTYLSSPTSSQTVIFNNPTTTLTVPGNNKTYTFIAKYSISPKQLLWVQKIESSSFVAGKSLELDNANNIYISGSYSNSIVLYNGGTPTTFTSSTNKTFLAKFDSNGNYNSTFGLKQISGTYNNAFSIKVDNTNNNVIYSHDDNITSFTSSGVQNWTRAIPSTGAIYDIETNNCGDVFVTGDSFSAVSKAPDHQNFFGILLNKNNGNTIWVSNALNDVNRGKNIFTYSDNSVKFIGDFNGNGINIDSFNSTISKGLFFAKLNSQNTNSCCNYNVTLGSDIVLCQGQSASSINIFNQGFDDPNFVIKWYLNGQLIQTGGLQLMSSVISGTVMVEVSHPDCEMLFTDSLNIIRVDPIVIDLEDTYYNCSDNQLELCGPIPPHGVTYNYNWGLTSSGLNLGQEQCITLTQPGNYSLTVTDSNGCSTAIHNFTITNQLPTVELGHDIIICDGDYHHIPPINISNQGFENSNLEINWYINGVLVQTGGTVLQMSPISGTVSVTISSPGCQTQTDQIEIITKVCCPEEVNINMILCPGQEPIFHILNQGYGAPGYIITWYFNGNVIQNGGEVLQLSINGNGILSVTVEKEGCKNVVTDQISISCDKDVSSDPKKESKIKNINKSLNVYPNPTNNIVNFVFNKNETGKIEIYSLEGKLVHAENFKENNELSANLSDYQAGIYVARITIGDEIIIKKIIKE